MIRAFRVIAGTLAGALAVQASGVAASGAGIFAAGIAIGANSWCAGVPTGEK